jgi:hypothetical protein
MLRLRGEQFYGALTIFNTQRYCSFTSLIQNRLDLGLVTTPYSIVVGSQAQ